MSEITLEKVIADWKQSREELNKVLDQMEQSITNIYETLGIQKEETIEG